MSEASDLIERMERETGQRIDSNDGDNMAMAGLFGALARAMGKSSHDARDDFAAGDEPICWECFDGHVSPCEMNYCENLPKEIKFNGWKQPEWIEEQASVTSAPPN